MSRAFKIFLIYVLTLSVARAQQLPQAVAPLIEASCIHCHDADTETGLSFKDLSYDLADADNFSKWERIFDRVHAGEMPPESEERPDPKELSAALDSLRGDLRTESLKQRAVQGRVPARRLTKLELGYTLRDLLLIDGDVTSGVPDETESGSFDTVGASQRLSAVHMESYLEAADEALSLAIRLGKNSSQTRRTNYGWLAEWHEKPLNLGGSITRKLQFGDGIALFRDADYLTAFQFGGNPFGGAGSNGIFRLTAEVAALQSKRPITAKIIVKDGTGGARLVKAVDLEPGDPQTIVVQSYLKRGEVPYLTFVEPKAGAIFAAGGAKNYKGPGLAILAQQVTGPLYESWPPPSTQELLTGLEFKAEASVLNAISVFFSGNDTEGQSFTIHAAKDSATHVSEIVRQFAPRAFRRPVSAEETQSFIDLAKPAITEERPLLDVVRIPLRSMLASPQFLLFGGQPGELDVHALANRLSYFLWKSMPDEQLFELAEEGTLSDPTVLAEQVERMLADEKSRRFVEDFVGQWLRLHKVNATTPDDGLYPEFDELLSDSIPKETQLFFAELLSNNESVCNLIDSDFAILNRRLAEHYDIDGVNGQEFQRVNLPDDHPRGGVLTQAAILKTTANGTNTSPVMRGNFVLTNLLGTPPSPPPPNVGSIEPDTRGQTTIREILAAHREIETCNRCHREIDPPGFALESFDPIGGYRTSYRVSGGQQTFGGFTNKLPPKTGPPVDASGVTAQGDAFSDVQQFKQLLMRQKEQVARNFISQLVVYATGGEIQFADRETIESILDHTRDSDFPVRDILHAVVASRLFRHK